MHHIWAYLSVLHDNIELQFLFKVVVCLLGGFVIGKERASKWKTAGVSTFSYVIIGAMVFSFLSKTVDPDSTSRIAAQIVSGIWFLWAGLIFVNKGEVRNLTTAAELWLASAIGMLVGFDYYSIALIIILIARFIPNGRELLVKENLLEEEERMVHAKKENKS